MSETGRTPDLPKPERRVAAFESMAFGGFFNLCLAAQLGQGAWHMKKVPIEEYDRLKDSFTAADFDPAAVVDLVKEAGARYLGIVARHHEGFSFFDTRGLSDFDVMHCPARRDLVAELADACHARDIAPFMVVVIWDWHFYLSRGYGPREGHMDDAMFNAYLDYLYESVEVLCTHYGPIGGFWFDGTWSRRDADWREDRLYALIRKHHPETIIINNSGVGARGALGHPETDCITFESGLARPLDRSGHTKHVAVETCQHINGHWGFAPDDLLYKSSADVIEALATCRRAGANYLTNIPATPQGGVPEMEAATLRKVGRWVRAYPDAVYNGRPVEVKCSGKDFVLEADGRWFYFAFGLASRGDADVVASDSGAGPRSLQGVPRPVKSARWLDSGEALAFAQNVERGFLTLDLTGFPPGVNLVVRVAEILF